MTTSDALTLRVRIEAPVATVYGALIDDAALRTWFAEHATVRLRESRYEFWGRHTVQGDRVRQRLQHVEPERTLRFAWELDGAEDAVITIALRPERGNGTTVEVGVSTLPGPDGDDDEAVCASEAVRTFWVLALDSLADYVEGRRLAPPFDFTTPAVTEARVALEVEAPAKRVYASLIEPRQVDRWSGGHSTIEPEVGGRYDYGWGYGPERIVELEHNRTLAHDWHCPEQPETALRWELREERGRTSITLVHSGFVDPRRAERSRLGWYDLLRALRRLHERGDAWGLITVEQAG